MSNNEVDEKELESTINYYINKCNLSRNEGLDALYRFCTFSHIKNRYPNITTLDVFEKILSAGFYGFMMPHYEVTSQAICQYLPIIIDKNDVPELIRTLNQRIFLGKYLKTQEEIQYVVDLFDLMVETAMKENGSILTFLKPQDFFVKACSSNVDILKFLLHSDLVKIYETRYNTKLYWDRSDLIEYIINPNNQDCYIYVSLPQAIYNFSILERSYSLLYSYLFNNDYANYIWGYPMKFARVVDLGSLDSQWKNLPINLACEFGTEFTMSANSHRCIDFVRNSSVTVATLKNGW